MICPNCTQPCEDSHKFCFACGAKLELPLDIDPLPAEEAPVEEISTEDIPDREIPGEESPVEALPIEEASAEETSAGEANIGEIPSEEAAITEEPAPLPAPPASKRGRLWPPALVLGILMLLGTLIFFLSQGGPGASPSLGETPWFTVKNGVLHFDPALYTGGEELTVPERVNGQKVTAIGEFCFSECNDLTTVILPDSVKKIDDYAFAGCRNLRGIYVPEYAKTIGKMAFADCSALEAVYLPGTLSQIGYGCFDGCESLDYVLYNGTYSQFSSLYSGYFPSNTELHATDGTFYASPRG